MTRAFSWANSARIPMSPNPRRINSARSAVPIALQVSTTPTTSMEARIQPRASQIPTPPKPQRLSPPTGSISANSAPIPTIQILFRTPTANTAVPTAPRVSTTPTANTEAPTAPSARTIPMPPKLRFYAAMTSESISESHCSTPRKIPKYPPYMYYLTSAWDR
jgi:hypothetical protein